MSKYQNDDNDYLRLFSIVFFAVESDSGVKWSLKMGPGAKKEDFEAQKWLENGISDLLTCLATFLAIWTPWDPKQKLLYAKIDHQTDFWPHR